MKEKLLDLIIYGLGAIFVGLLFGTTSLGFLLLLDFIVYG